MIKGGQQHLPDHFLGSLLVLPVECSKEKVQNQNTKQQSNLQMLSNCWGVGTSKLAVWETLHGDQSLTALKRLGILE